MRILLAFVVGAVVTACSGVVDDTRPPVLPVRPGHDDVVRDHMRASYDLARGVEQLLLRGDLRAARSLAHVLANTPVPAGAAFAAQEDAVRDRAADVARAPDIDEALRAEARLAAACAGCHRAAGAFPDRGPRPPAPPDDDSIDAQMARHRWAAAMLWDAAIGGSDQAWQAGLDVLAEAPLDWPGRSDRARYARWLQESAAAARGRWIDPVMRAHVHGDLLVACAACHAVRGDADELRDAGIE